MKQLALAFKALAIALFCEKLTDHGPDCGDGCHKQSAQELAEQAWRELA